MGQSRLFGRVSIRSGIPLTADKQAVSGFWRDGPQADIIWAIATSAYSFALGTDQSTNLTGIGKDYIRTITHHASGN